MDLMDLLILLLLVLSTPALAVLREFHFVNLLKTWTEAQSYCRERFLDLATIENADDCPQFKKMVGDSGHWGAWIGLYDDVKSWRWSLDNTSLFEQELGSWLVFNEDNFRSTEHCAVVYQGALRDENCEENLWFVCYDETHNSYVRVEEPKSWQSAQNYCRQTYTGLASVRNQDELNAIKSLVQATTCWIGLSRESWKWSDLSDSSFRDWGSVEPTGGAQSCGGVTVIGWFDDYCQTQKRPFICSVPPKRVLRVRLKTDGSVNPNDPLVQEAILKQMEKDLKGQRVHQEFSLRWRKQPHGDVFNKPEL